MVIFRQNTITLKQVVFFIIFITLTSCVTVRKNVRVLKPAEINIPSDVRSLAVIKLNTLYSDIVQQSFLEALSDESVKTRFSLSERDYLDKVFSEQSLNLSDEFDESTAARLGELSGAQGLIVCGIKDLDINKSSSVVSLKRRYLEGTQTDSKGNKNPVYRYTDEIANSTIQNIKFIVELRFINLHNGTIIVADSLEVNNSEEIYIDTKPAQTVSVSSRSGARIVNSFLPATTIIKNNISKFVQSFTKKIAPYYSIIKMKFQYIHDDFINKNMIQFVRASLYEEALELMNESLSIIDVLPKKEHRSIHYFNIGSLYEIQGDLYNALNYYNKSTKVDAKRVNLDALRNCKLRIADHEKLINQLE